jgi:mRNA-degrading endonuclease toxin of MazEF toxin-antitoxin module
MAARRIVSYPRRGEVYLVNFDPTLGAEIKKTRPALVLQNDIGNRYSPLTIVAAITSHLKSVFIRIRFWLLLRRAARRKTLRSY